MRYSLNQECLRNFVLNLIFRNISLLYLIIAFCSAFGLLCYDVNRDYLSSVVEAWGGGVLYVMFWIFLNLFIFSNKFKEEKIIFFVISVVILIEFSQLIKFQVLDNLRNTKIGYILLGTTFSWYDVPPYLIGALISYLIYFFINFHLIKK